MDLWPAPAVQEAIQSIVGSADYGYPRRPRMPAEMTVADAFALRMADRFGWHIDPAAVQPVTDLLQATIATILGFSAPGDGIAIHTPCYPPFREAIEEAGRRIVEIPMRDDGQHFSPDMDALASVPDNTRVLLLCNPHNPTGRVFTRQELDLIGTIAGRKGLVIFSDEIHADLVYEGAKHIPIATLSAEIAAKTITANSPSKSFNIPGLRCGVIHFGSSELMARFRQRVPRLLLGKPSAISIDAAVAAWTECDEWLDETVHHLTRMRDLVMEALRRDMPELRVYAPEGTYLAWIDCSAMNWSQTAGTVFLDRSRIAFSGGETFCSRHGAFVRLNFATSPDILEELLERMRKTIQLR
jgi:cystathionine beta-lyase